MKLKPIPTLFILLCTSFYFSGCKREPPQAITQNTSGVQQFSSYPFVIGREWHYNTTLTTYMSDTTTYNYVKVYKHLSDTVINGILCHKIGISNSSSASNNYTQYSYYANMSDGLHIIANEGNAGGFTWLRSNLLNNMKTRMYEPGLGMAQIDSVFLPSPALHLTKLPIVYGQEWYSYEYGSQFQNKRKWIASSILNSALGSFSCVQLQFISGVGNPANFQVYQHFGDKGLIKTEMRQDSLLTGNGDVGYLISISELSYINF